MPSDTPSLPITVYSPASSVRRPAEMLADMFRDLLNGRELAYRLASRDIQAQYRQTAFGFLWAFILPLAHTITWLFLSGSGIVQLSETVLPYPVYVFTGTIIWAIFMDAVNMPLQQTMAAMHMLAKIKFPREALILAGIYKILFNGAIKIALLLPALLFFGIYPQWTLLLFPLGILSLILTGTALGLLLTPVGMLYTDIGKGLPLLMQFVMYLTPVVFPMPKDGWALTVFEWNPLTPLIITTRNWLTGFASEHLVTFVLINGAVIGLLFLVWIVYRAAMPVLIERLSA